MKKKLNLCLATLLIFSGNLLFSQNDTSMLSMLDQEEETVYVGSTYKSTRIVNSHSLKSTPKGVLDFRIAHRFGFVNTGIYEMFGLDQATIRLGFDYGITDWLMVGVGRSSFDKTYDGFVRAKILRQSTGAKEMPISLQYLATTEVNTLKWENPDRDNLFSSRLAYTHQLIIGRKFSKSLTLQLMPTFVHRNLVENEDLSNDVLALGGGGRVKITNRVAITGEYYYVLPDQIQDFYENSIAIGVDIETGGHVFQLHVTNSTPMVENGFITQTTGNPLDGDIHFGFNISRVFTIVKPKSFRKSK
ncbi:DUF5777 family beta-barrel protein [Salibacter sp.]|uniref:DUF5777 family beta-barrel protein n=1 Tax=Salibacter sp. TaxID=2010995 RepID=UPI0028707260|nr:DUF5777 family beta-barrel protein [Salibacter sp.]MDR9398047.1 DUF5777 family beta-barrel protein [Salibacter sp.]MDR9486913.1 DUF5777 family beta-barrel protein [Salibacter sp.]